MKMYIKCATICVVVTAIVGGYWMFNTQAPVAPVAPVIPIVEPEEERDLSWIKIDEDVATAKDDEKPLAKEPSVTVTEEEDGTVVIDREWGSKPEGANTKPSPNAPDTNMAAGGGDIELDADGVYQGDVVEPEPTPEPEKPKPTPEPTPEPKPEPTPEPKPEEPKKPDVDPVTGKPNFDGEWMQEVGEWEWFGDEWVIPSTDNGGISRDDSDMITGGLTGNQVGNM